ASLIDQREAQEGHGVDPRPGHLGPEVKVRARGPSYRSHRPKSLAALHALALGDRDRVEVEIGGMEPQTVVEDDQSAREEELGHERDLAGVDGNDGRSLRSRIVAAGVW